MRPFRAEIPEDDGVPKIPDDDAGPVGEEGATASMPSSRIFTSAIYVVQTSRSHDEHDKSPVRHDSALPIVKREHEFGHALKV